MCKTRTVAYERPLDPAIMAERNRSIKDRLSTSNLVLGSSQSEWTVTSRTPVPNLQEAYNPEQSKLNRQKACETSIKLTHEAGGFQPWASTSVLPIPTGDLSQYRGKLAQKTAKSLRTSSLRLGAERRNIHNNNCAYVDTNASIASDCSVLTCESFSAKSIKERCMSECNDDSYSSVSRVTMTCPDAAEVQCMVESNRKAYLKHKMASYNSVMAVTIGSGGALEVSPADMSGWKTREAHRDMCTQNRKCNVILGDSRVRVLTTAQKDSLDAVVEAAKKIGYGKAYTHVDPKVLKKQLQGTTICLGESPVDYSTSSYLPNWFDPLTYAIPA